VTRPTELTSCVLGGLRRGADGYYVPMPLFENDLGRCIDAYEAGIRTATDAQLTVARLVDLEPVRSVAAMWADLTRDIGATQVSNARWMLDV
jgi:hypothetical protein